MPPPPSPAAAAPSAACQLAVSLLVSMAFEAEVLFLPVIAALLQLSA
jgi:hypothetical protein